MSKIFVGNVPYQCTDDEFKECFKNIKGYVNAEILISRGFGFVTLETEEDAVTLLSRNDIIFKDRVLRFTRYNPKASKKSQKQEKNCLFVKNIPTNMNREQLKALFINNGINVGACFINTNIKTGKSYGNAIVEIKDKNIFENLLEEKFIDFDTHIFKVSRWINSDDEVPLLRKVSKHGLTDNLCAIAFNTGVEIGRLEGLKIAKLSSKKNEPLQWDTNFDL